MSRATPDPIAVVGIGCVYPGAADAAAFWRNVAGAADAITTMPADRYEPELFDFGTDRGGFVTGDALWFEPGRFGIVPRTVTDTDPDQFMALATAAAALDDAGAGPGSSIDPERVGVILGRGGYLTPAGAQFVQRVRTSQQLVTVLRTLLPEVGAERIGAVRDAFVEQLGEMPPDAAVGVLPNMAASRIANRLDLGGPAYIVDAACASSLVAVDAGITELTAGRCDLVLAGGVHHADDLVLWAGFAKLGALSPTGAIRPYSRHADGILIGEGTGMVALERLSDAERLGHRVYAVLRGTGVSSDGRDASLVSPNVDGQVLALDRAYRSSGVDPATVELVEGHGTATPTGDRAELETIRRVFGKADGVTPPGVLGSVKSMIGHAMPAAGAAGLIKAVLAVHHGVLPPTLHGGDPHPALADTRFRLLDAAEPWEAAGGRLRRAGVNAFGFGGINAHVVVEEHRKPRMVAHAVPRREAPGAAADEAGRSDDAGPAVPADGGGEPIDFAFEAVLLAGQDAAELGARLAAVTERFAAGETITGAGHPEGEGPARLAVVAPNEKRLKLAARALAKGTAWRGLNDVWATPKGLVTAGGRVAFLFPGVEPTFDADLGPVARWFGRVAPEIPDGLPALETHGRQILAAGRLLDDVLGDLGIRPDDIGGHSMGEWTAWYPAELIPRDGAEAFLDVLEPGAFEVPDVAYLALGCGADVAAEAIDGLDGVAVSHDNCAHQSVVCGPIAGIERARARFAERKVVAQELPFRSGFHSPAFEPYVGRLVPVWERIPLERATTRLWSATSCAPYPTDHDAIRELAIQHLVEPVRFRELTERLYGEGVRAFVQPGVGSLPAFVADTLGKRPHLAASAYTPKHGGLGSLARVAAGLWVEGVDVEFSPLARRAGAAAAAGAARAGQNGNGRPGGHRVRLALGTPLVRLPASARLDDAVRSAAGPAPAAPTGFGAALASAHDALLSETLDAGRDVAAAFARRSDGTGHATGHGRNGTGNGNGRTGNGYDGNGRASAPAPVAAPAPAAPTSSERTIRVDLASFPWLRDHCVIQQRRDWRDPSDAFPVVPATGLVQMMADAAADLVPGTVVTAIEGIRATRWVTAAPATDVTVRAQLDADAPDTVQVTLDGAEAGRPFARATVRLAAPAAAPAPPAPTFAPLTDPVPSPRDARALYDEGWMFHGPLFEGIHHVGPLGTATGTGGVRGIEGEIECLPTPGATLDSAAQVYGWWVLATQPVNSYVLPQSIERVELFAPLPPGLRLHVSVRITDLTDRTVTGALELVDRSAGPPGGPGRVVARITGSVVRRFNSDGHLWACSRFPGREQLSTTTPDGVVVVDERWRDSASRELMSYLYLNAAERTVYQGLRPIDQRFWLLGRIAAKDAVRTALRAAGHAEVYPAEVTIADGEDGRPVVADAPFGGTGLAVAVGHAPWVGAAVVGAPRDRPGVAVVAVGAPGPAAAAATVAASPAELSAEERAVLPAGDADRWVARALAAKQAAGPRLAVVAADPATGEVRVGDRRVATALRSAPVQATPGDSGTFAPHPVPPSTSPDENKEYAIAWTHRDA